VIENIFLGTYADLIEFPWILDSHPLTVRYFFNLYNFLYPLSPKIDLILNVFFRYFIEDLISCKAKFKIYIVLNNYNFLEKIGARIWLYELIFSPFTDISIITTIWLRTINRLISVSWSNFQSYSATHLQKKVNFLPDFFWNFDFFFYFWPPLLIKIQFKFDFQISRVSKIINIIFFWTVFFPSSPPA